LTLHIQSDNTSREVKNNHCMRFLSSLVCHGPLALLEVSPVILYLRIQKKDDS
jgi:hypothetical protein